MCADVTVYKADIGKEVDVKELESLIASNGAVIHRVDQSEGKTLVFFSGDKESLERCGESLSRYGKVAVDSSSVDELGKVP